MASVTYQIKGKYDGKAVNQANSGMQNLAKAAGTVNKAVGAFVIAKVMQGVTKAVNGSREAFIAQNKAVTQFNVAIQKANLPLKEMEKLRNSISNGNFFDADSLNNAMTMASAMGLNAEQMDSVMKAATDMAAAGIMPLDQAVKQLGQTYTGTTGQLGKMIPEVKKMTKEQLKNGEAVDLLKNKYAGFASAMSNTFSGRDTQFKNAFGDLQAAIGGIGQSFKFITEGKLINTLNSVTDWLVDNRNSIVSFVVNIPTIAKTAIEGVWTMIKKTFTGDGLKNLINYIIQAGLEGAKLLAGLIWDITKNAFQNTLSLFKLLIDGDFWKTVADFFARVGNLLLDNLNVVLVNILGGPLGTLVDLIYSKKTGKHIGSNWDIGFRFDETPRSDGSAIAGFKTDIGANTKELAKNVASDFADWAKKNAGLLGDFGSFYENEAQVLKTSLQEVIKNADIPEDLKLAMSNMVVAMDTNTEAVTEETDEQTKKKGLGLELGEVQELAKAFSEGTGWSYLINKILSAVEGVSEIVNNVMNSVSYIIEAMLPPIVDILETILAPVLPVLQTIGKTVGLLFSLIAPIFTGVIGTVLKSVLTVVVTVLGAIYNAIVAVHNLFANRWNDWEYMNIAQSVSDIWNPASSQAVSSSYGGGISGSSYSAAKDIYVNIYYNNSFVNGDAREIAINLRNEIRSAEALGY